MLHWKQFPRQEFQSGQITACAKGSGSKNKVAHSHSALSLLDVGTDLQESFLQFCLGL